MCKIDTVGRPLQLNISLNLEQPGVEGARLDVNGSNPQTTCCYRVNGLTAQISRFPQGRFVKLFDEDTATALFWFILPWNSGPDALQTVVSERLDICLLPRGGWGNGNMQLEFGHSRNLEPEIRNAAAWPDATYQKKRNGPTHLLWCIHPAENGPFVRFKDVGVNEDGGVKFRCDDLGYILFSTNAKALEHATWKDAERPVAELVIMRYVRRELDTLWEVGSWGIKRHG